ncbi:hypothetical protein [Caenimonas sp. SL110]|uniref:tetratricopeptide repeat protein n=1 Tax=Caenimonas sp. SL110 TaxID=1450524 RepID=UPI0006549AD1|nr:hypothetical protein [Caenimonas sp. SL110]
MAGFFEPADFGALAPNSREVHALAEAAIEADPDLAQVAAKAAILRARDLAGRAAATSIDRMDDLHVLVANSCLEICVAISRRRQDAWPNAQRLANLAADAGHALRDFENNPGAALQELVSVSMKLGRCEQAIELVRLTPDANPDLEPHYNSRALAHLQLMARQFPQAVVTATHALEIIGADDIDSRRLFLQVIVAANLCQGQFAEARKFLDQLTADGQPAFGLQAMLAHSRGDKPACDKALEAFLETDPPHAELAELYGWQGHVDLALHHLKFAVADEGEQIVHSPMLDPIRHNEYFQMTLRQLKLSPADLAGITFDLQLPAT